MNSMIENGPVTIMLVFSKTCPHCVTYMPIWKKLCNTQGRKANMISMEASTYQNTEFSKKKSVSAVPSILYVNQQGEITEAPTPRDTTVMTNAVRVTPESDLPASVVMSANVRKTSSEPKSMTSEPKPLNMSQPKPLNLTQPKPLNLSQPKPLNLPNTVKPLTPAPLPPISQPTSEPAPLSNAVIPGTMTSENPLKPLPATLIQSGGNPWAAFLMAAKQAAPAAALLGAYAALPTKRSSGLGIPRRTRRRIGRV